MIRRILRRRSVPELNTTSTADISFMLLIFFLVTTSLDTDTAMRRQLPPQQKDETQNTRETLRRNIITVTLAADNTISIDGREVDLPELKATLKNFIENPHDDPTMPEHVAQTIPLLGRCRPTTRHAIQVASAPETDYDTYFNVQNAIMTVYYELRDSLARRHFHHTYRQCAADEKTAICKYYPQRIADKDL